MSSPPFVVFDVETGVDGRGSTEFYRHDFRVLSAAFSWLEDDGSIKSKFVVGEDAVRAELVKLIDECVPLVAHNVQFEIGVVKCRFPDLHHRITWHACTMRLVQVFDNGGDEFAVEQLPLSYDELLDSFNNISDDDETKSDKKPKKPKSIAGLSLRAALKRLLKDPLSHKDEAHEWLRNNIDGCRSGGEGAYLTHLPPDLLERYNIGDTEGSLKLYTYITESFSREGYDWRFDHNLYLRSVRQLVDAKIRGVPVNREALSEYRESVFAEVERIGADFHARFAVEIAAVERGRLLDSVRKRKTLRGRKSFVGRYRVGASTAVKDVQFNVGSNKQLASLFVDQLGLPVKFTTAKGSPSFKSALLGQWGAGGEMLKARRKRFLVYKQACSLLSLSEYDGRWHTDLRACGTSTGRFSGGQHA
jgi:hypothetical protein